MAFFLRFVDGLWRLVGLACMHCIMMGEAVKIRMVESTPPKISKSSNKPSYAHLQRRRCELI